MDPSQEQDKGDGHGDSCMASVKCDLCSDGLVDEIYYTVLCISMTNVSGFDCYLTNHHKLTHSKQYPFIMSWFCR